ncbi:MAG: hypothetical protein R2813_12660 [Flavobacteriales bacterium]
MTQDFVFTTDLAKSIFRSCDALFEGKYLILWIMNHRLTPDTKVMDAFAQKSRANRVRAEAFCLGSPTLYHLANFYLRIKKPAVPATATVSESEAREWLSSAMEKLNV